MLIDCAFVQICASNQCTLNTLFKYMADPDLGISRGPPELVNIAALCMNRCGHCHCVNEVYPFDDLPTQIHLAAAKLDIRPIQVPLLIWYLV